MCGVKAGDETAALQGAQLGRCSRSRTDDIIEGELQSSVVLVSSLMLVEDNDIAFELARR